jgi:hypothetical protein
MSDQEPEKNNLINFIAATVETMRDQMSEMRGQIIDITDRMATKSDLAQLESRLTAKLEAETTAIRGDIEQVHLVKDRPEMLRLLGQTPPASDEGRP